ncbi:MAG: hypothetical protein KJ884_13035 [Gammaproteobacteria bacterium]|uniref:Putative head decoration protein n=1 Tax=viral metagenome TaxID=1070528 RepID=A0A6M3JAL0_9ZZZZ|nr:hypothetical protein [Gammaproteobacteria bacterium]MBU1492224.1 hypothetical protein [Gammaproteobacteria bacterium]MBU2066795.1 hypothetical protein [Gammaproteobacteria bacterium]MBU2137389.1 hypothetical protein [Gammaproteobacteria bacterium]MBU2215050.1 hypothetical protein [Gammaproteobacteria bacterium]
MARVKETALIGGRFSIGKPGGRMPTDFVGIIRTAQERIEQSELREPDTTNPLGGTYDSFTRIDRFFLDLEVAEITSGNLARAMAAVVNEVPSEEIEDEDVILGVGQTTALDKMPLEIRTVTFDGSDYEEDLDWRITGAGIMVLEESDLAAALVAAAATSAAAVADGGNVGNGTLGTLSATSAVAAGAYTVTITNALTGAFSVTGPAGATGVGDVGTAYSVGGLQFTLTAGGTEFEDGDSFTITVTAPAPPVAKVNYLCARFDEIEYLTSSGEDWYLLFEGANAVGEKGKFNAHYYRVSFAPTTGRDVISVENFMGLPMVAEVKREDTRATSDVKSAYGKLQKQRLLQ